MGKGATQKPLAPAQVYALVPGEPERGSEVVTGTTPVLGFEALVLFDSGAIHSFVSIVFTRLSRLVVRTLEPGLVVTTPVGKMMVYKRAVCEWYSHYRTDIISRCGPLGVGPVRVANVTYGMFLCNGWGTGIVL